MNISRIAIRLFKRDLHDKIKLAFKTQNKSLEEISLIQEEKFLKLIEHAKLNVPYYKDKLKNVRCVNDITKINFLNKADIKNNMQNLRANNIPSERFVLDSTSGSTGESMPYFRDKIRHNRLAVGYRCDSRAGYCVGSKVLYLWGAERDILKNRSLYVKIKDNYIHREKRLSTYHMTDKDIEDYIRVLNKYKPETIIAYPTPLFYFANYIEQNNIKICQLKGIISSAETLFPFQREKIEKVFNCKIFNRYGCREVGNIASECEVHEGLHINSDHILLEIINEYGEKCKPGEIGEIVVTDLDEYTFPLIRYRIGDIGVISKDKCTCGINLPLLQKVEGRVFDLIVGVNNNLVGGTFWTLLRRSINGFNKFQIIQEKKGFVNIVVEKNKEMNFDFKEILIKKVKEKLGSSMNVNIEIVKEIPLTKTGKHRWVISKVSPFVR